MGKQIKPKFYDKLFFLQFLIVWYIIFSLIVLIDGTIDLLDAFIVIIIGGTIFAIITYSINHLFKIWLYRFSRIKTCFFIVGILFILASIGGFSSGDYLAAIIVFLIGYFLSYKKGKELIMKFKYKKKENKFIRSFFFSFFIFLFGFLGLYYLFVDIWIGVVFFALVWIIYKINKPIGSVEIKKIKKEEMSCICDYCLKNVIRPKNSKIPIFYINNIPYSYHQDCYKNTLLNEKINQEKRGSSTFFAKPKEHKTKTKSSKLEEQSHFDEKQEDIEEFFKALQRKKKVIAHHDFGTILNDANYNLFYSFINETNKSLDILCWRVDERLLSEMLWFLKDKNINIKIITKNRIKKGYLTEFKKYCSSLILETSHRNKIHAKFIIRDNKDFILGSSNFTEASMSESGHFLDCNITTKHSETVESAIDLFKSLLQNKNYTKEIQNSKLRYSRNHKEYLPFSLKPYFEKENEEIILLFSCNMVDKRIVDRIIEWNSKTPINLYVGDTWRTSELSRDNLNSMKWLYDTSIGNYKNVKVVPVTDDIHSKLYLFKNQNIAFISSQNLTVESWQSLLEAGILTDDKKDFKYLYDSINSFKKSQLTKIEFEDLEETSKPESTFSGSEHERSMSIPWELPEANAMWMIPRTRNQSYYKLIKHKPRQKKEEGLENAGKRSQTSKIIKSHLLERLESEYLSNQSETGLYDKPTRYIISGKLSKAKQLRDLERKLEYFKKKYEMAASEENRKRYKDGIDYIEKQLEEFE